MYVSKKNLKMGFVFLIIIALLIPFQNCKGVSSNFNSGGDVASPTDSTSDSKDPNPLPPLGIALMPTLVQMQPLRRPMMMPSHSMIVL